MLKLIVKENFKEILDYFKHHFDVVFIKAYRSAVNKAMKKAGTRASEQIREVYSLKAREVSPTKGKYLNIRKAKGETLALLNAELKASIQPVSLIKFSKQQQPTPQKGIAVADRKRLKDIKVGPSLRVHLPNAFIARASGRQGDGQAYQIFTRGKGKKGAGKLFKKAMPSVFKVLKRSKFYNALDDYARGEFEKDFKHEYEYYASKALKQ